MFNDIEQFLILLTYYSKFFIFQHQTIIVPYFLTYFTIHWTPNVLKKSINGKLTFNQNCTVSYIYINVTSKIHNVSKQNMTIASIISIAPLQHNKTGDL